MLKLYNYDIVFGEIPDEVTLAFNISNCKNGCVGCHSPWLQKNVGKDFDEYIIDGLMNEYRESITCVCFMGGDFAPNEIGSLANYVKNKYLGIKTAWYSGKENIDEGFDVNVMDYIKIGPYKAKFGGLKSKTTNQRLFKICDNGIIEDITFKFWK